ncbi:hypothetical protein BDAP_002460 [Binucleata daphniae]
MKNKVAGYVTVLMKRIQNGYVKGIYIKKHEEERERKENFIPKKSILDENKVYVDSLTQRMITEYGYIGNYVVDGVEEREEETVADE